MHAGGTDKIITMNSEQITKIGSVIGNSLKHIRNIDCDIFQNNDIFYILEMNPRFGGGYPSSYMAGANIPAAIIAWFHNEQAADEFFIYEFGKAFAKCDTLKEIKFLEPKP